MRSRPPAAGEAVFFLRPATLLSTLLIALAAAAAAVAAGAESPWLSITAPERVIVLESGRASEAVVALELENRHHKRVRVEDVRIVYLDGARVLRTETPGRTFFDDPVFSRSPRIEAGAGATWRGLCLADPPPGADRVRFEIDLASRGGRTRNRNTQAVAVELVPAPEPVPLSLPFEGYWKVTQGHGCSTNHRAGALGGELAWDFAAIGGLSGRQTGDAGTGDALTFGARILSPADGRVVRVVDGV
ncbi:MAG: hypothetical protein R3344_10075, partial [Acidobacteriota bacterium]|nr:hypothetical protein [Acidobacteriota bacterium]